MGCDIGSQVQIVDLGQHGRRAPIAGAAHKTRGPADLIVRQLERAGAHGVLRPICAFRLKAPMHNGTGKGIKLLGQRTDRPAQMQGEAVVIQAFETVNRRKSGAIH